MTDAPSPARRIRADGLIAASAGVILLGLLFYSGENWAMVLYRLLSDGLLAVLWIAAAYGWGRTFFNRICTTGDGVSSAGPLLRFITLTGLGLGGFSLLFLLLGLAGWLIFPVVLTLLVAGAGMAVWPLRHGLGGVELSLCTRWQWLWLAVMPWVAMMLMASLVPPGVLWRGEPNGYDVVEYHLEVPREWYQQGAIRPLEHNVFSYMPMNVEVQYLAAMTLRGGPWAGMYLAQYLHAAFILLSVLAVVAFASAAGAGRASAVLGGVAAATVPWMSLLAPIAYNEGGLLLFGTLGIGWAMLGLRDGGQGSWWWPWLLAGLFAGFACGVKLTAVPMIGVAVSVAAVVIAVIARNISFRRLVVSLAAFSLSALIVFSPWLIRNQVWAGNPVYPELMSLLGAHDFTPTQVRRYQQAHSPRADQRSVSAHFRAGWEQIVAEWSYGYILLPVGLLAGAVALWGAFRRQALFLLLMLLMLGVIWIGFTHLQGRFFVLCIPILALLIAQVNWRAWQWPLAVLILAAGGIGFVRLNQQLMPWLEPGLPGMEDFTPFRQELLPREAIRQVDAGKSLALVGDARAFLYQMPISRLYYRTVFDVAAGEDEDWLQAWLGGRSADVIVVDPNELRRFARTYYGLPLLPDSIAQQTAPFVHHP